jgi:WhiB family redox-sensing transcriptional regulator
MLPEVLPMPAIDHPVPAPPRWRGRAACADAATDAEFFPLDEDGRDARPAKAVCAGCGVRELCLAYALDWGMAAGIWGGLSTRERESLMQPWHGEARRRS